MCAVIFGRILRRQFQPDVRIQDAERGNGMQRPSRHVLVAINHLNKRREALLEKKRILEAELKELDAAILALDVPNAER